MCSGDQSVEQEREDDRVDGGAARTMGRPNKAELRKRIHVAEPKCLR